MTTTPTVQREGIAKFSQYALGVITTIAFLSSPLLASDSALTISDCNGDLRFSQSISEATNVDLSVTLKEDVANSKGIVLASNAASEKKYAILSETENEKIALFNKVSAGEWKVCSSDGSYVSFSKVSLGNTPLQTASVSTGSSGIIGASVAAVGVAAGAISLSSSSSSSSSTNDGRGGAGSLNTSENNTSSNTEVASIVPPSDLDASSFDDDDFSFGAKGAPLSPAS